MMMDCNAFELSMPEVRTNSLVFASPHSGRDYPVSLMRRTVLDATSIRSSEDAFVDILFDGASRYGSPFLKARTPRAFVDLNRSCDELDPALISGVARTTHNPRVTSGLGVIPRVVSNGRSIYRGKLPRLEAEARISSCWRPYHDRLQALLDESIRQFDEAILVDCHSMPHEAIDSIAHSSRTRPDVVIGDRFGAAAHSEIVEQIEAAFAGQGLNVVRNAPFAGAYITQHYGRPSRRQHAVQVEIDRSLYMHEADLRPKDSFDAFKATIDRVVADLVKIGRADLPLAAE